MINAQSAAPFTPPTGPTASPVVPAPSMSATQATPGIPPAAGIGSAPTSPLSSPPIIGAPPSMDTVPNGKPPEKKGMSKNFKVALAALLLLVVVVGSGVGLYLNQQSQDVRQQAEEVKPTETPVVREPERTALPVGSYCTKKAYIEQGAGTLIETKSFNSSQKIFFKINITQNTGPLPLIINDNYSELAAAGYEFVGAKVTSPDDACTPPEFGGQPENTFRCEWRAATPGESIELTLEFRPTISYLVEPEKIEAKNKVSLEPCELCGGGAFQEDTQSIAPPTAFMCDATIMIPGNTGVIPTPTVEPIACNSLCNPGLTNAEGLDACGVNLGKDYVCTQVTGAVNDTIDNAERISHRCRLKANATSNTCQAAAVVPTPTATPAVGCNQTCTTNADCSNPNHVCSDQNGSKVCRLSNNVGSSSCSSATSNISTPTPTPTPTVSSGTGTQPTLPSELPQTGAGDFNNWVKAGLGTLGLGILFLLLL